MWLSARLSWQLVWNGGLAQRHAVALNVEKPGANGCLGGIASAGCLRTIRYSHFRERSCSISAKKKTLLVWSFNYGSVSKRFCFPWGLLARWPFYKYWWLRFAQSDLPRGRFLRAVAVLAVGRSQCEGQEGRTSWEVRMILPLPTHLQARSNTPSAFLGCRVRHLVDSEAGCDALSSGSCTSCRRDSRLRCCTHDSRSRSWTSEFLETTEGKADHETTTRWTTSFTKLDQ